MSDNSYFQGSDNYIGTCPECGGLSYTNYDEICEKCLDSHPIKCPFCFTFVMPYEFNIKHGKCNECVEYDAQEFSSRIKSKLNTIILAQTIKHKYFK